VDKWFDSSVGFWLKICHPRSLAPAIIAMRYDATEFSERVTEVLA